MSETGWLIERGDSSHGCPEYLAVHGTYSDADPGRATGIFVWDSEPRNALRFSRKEDAAKFAGGLRSLMAFIPYGNTESLRGLRDRFDLPRIIEHSFTLPTK